MAQRFDSTEKDNQGAGRNGNVPPASSRWKPGQSGNPHGRAKGSTSLLARLEARLCEAILNGDKDLGDAVVDSMVRAILKDPVKAWPILKELIRWGEGQVGWAGDGCGGEGRRLPDYEGFERELRRMVERAKKGSGDRAGSDAGVAARTGGTGEERR